MDDDLKRRIDASREAGYADELKRIDREIDSRAQELLRQTLDREEAVRQEKLKSLEADQLRARQAIVAREEEFRQKLQDSQREKQERLKRAREERRLREEAEQRRREEEERLRAEEDRRRKEEEEARQKAEEERRRQEEEIRRQAEEERRKEEERLRREEELRKKEEEERRKLQEEIRRKEGELRRQEEERRERIITLIASAEVLFANNDYENARVEVAKALVNDPENPEARALERKIKEAQGISVTEQTPEPEPEYVPAPVPEDLRTINTISPAGAIKGEAKPRGKKWFIIAAVVVIAGLVVLWQVQKGLFPSSFKVAVLPFSSSANSIEEARLGSSLAMEVINRFEHVEALEVMAYPSAVNLQSGSRPPEQEAYRLGFLYALRGSVRQNSGGIEVQVTLEDSSGMKAWSKTYPVSTRELSGFASLLVHDVLEVMEIDASTIERVTRQHSATPAPGLYAFYLGGLEQLGRPGAGGAEAAYSFFMQALSEESTYAQAAAGASLALLTSMDPQFQIPESSMQKAESLAKTALTYDPLNPEAHLALARLLLMKKKYELAGSQLDTVSQETPNNADAFLLRARIRTELGEYRKAFDDAVRAYSLNPRDMDVLTTLANIHLLLGSIREGFGYIESVVAIAPDSTEFLIGPYANAILFEPELLLTHSGRVRRACERRLLANPQDYRALYRLARMMQVSGSALEGSALFEKNVRLIQAALKSDPGDPEKTMYLALTLTRLGRYPEASNLTRRMVEQWGKSAFVQYKAAQVSALQMYSQKKKETDPKKQEEVLAFLKTAMRQRFMLQEIVDGDFYNVFDKKEFRSAIRAVVE